MRNLLFKSLWLFIIAATVLSGLVNAQDTREITWYTLEEAQEKSVESDKDIMVFAVTEWCVYCKAMDRKAFRNSQIVTKINDHFYPVRIDIESDEAIIFNAEKVTKAQFAERYDINIPPMILFINQKGEVLYDYTGFISEDVFRQLLSAWDDRKNM